MLCLFTLRLRSRAALPCRGFERTVEEALGSRALDAYAGGALDGPLFFVFLHMTDEGGSSYDYRAEKGY